MSKLRFAVVISHPIQHYSPIFQALARDPGIDLKAFYLCDHAVHESFDRGFNTHFAWDVDLTAGHAHEFLRPGFSPRNFGFLETDAPNLGSRLDEFRPHALWTHGYGQRLSWRALSWARHRAAVIYFGDSELVHSRSRLKRLVKKLVLPGFFRRCAAVITIGDNNEAYYRHYGVPETKLVRGACPIDVSSFMRGAEKMTERRRRELRAAYGVPENAFQVITSGKLEPRKRPFDVVEAVARLKSTLKPVHVLMIGDGILRAEIELLANSRGCGDRIHVSGFVNQSDLPELIATGDALVMASDMDPHPLAVSEALPAGLPIIVSDRVGCVGPTDTARPGVNAFVYPCGDCDALAEAIARLEGDSGLWRRYSDASRSLAPTQDFEVTAKAVLGTLATLQPTFESQWSDVGPAHFARWRESESAFLRPDGSVA